MVDPQTHPPPELPPFNSVGFATCHLLSPCHRYHFKESFQRQFAHFLQTDLSPQVFSDKCTHTLPCLRFFLGFFELVVVFA